MESTKTVVKSVVKIYSISAPPSFSSPWRKSRQRASTSSGFIVDGRRILCNAHGVSFSSSVRVRKHAKSKKFTARILHVGHECDLAILTVDEESFWTDTVPLTFRDDIPTLQESVSCFGYPTGGDNISVTKGVISRIDFAEYSHAGGELIVIQIDAAINAGNSGGPAILGGEVVGVAFETLNVCFCCVAYMLEGCFAYDSLLSLSLCLSVYLSICLSVSLLSFLLSFFLVLSLSQPLPVSHTNTLSPSLFSLHTERRQHRLHHPCFGGEALSHRYRETQQVYRILRAWLFVAIC